MIDAKRLHGFTVEDAQAYGMPHVGAHYTADDVNRYERDDDACFICGKPATNTHHHPSKGRATSFTLETPKGRFVSKPALFAVCGSGTTGCHGLIHAGKVKLKWEWDRPEYQEAWFAGELQSHGAFENSPELYRYGRWKVGDGTTWAEIRRA